LSPSCLFFSLRILVCYPTRPTCRLELAVPLTRLHLAVYAPDDSPPFQPLLLAASASARACQALGAPAPAEVERINICDVNQGHPGSSKPRRVVLRRALTPLSQLDAKDFAGLSHSGPCRSLPSTVTKARQTNITWASRRLCRRRRLAVHSRWIPTRTALPSGEYRLFLSVPKPIHPIVHCQHRHQTQAPGTNNPGRRPDPLRQSRFPV